MEAIKPTSTYGGGSGKQIGYVVEAKLPEETAPQKYGDVIITSDWRRLSLDRASVGIPNMLYCKQAEDLGLLTVEAAVGLAAWFKAQAWPFGSCLQFRLVAVEVSYQYSTKEVGVTEPLTAFEHFPKTTPRDELLDKLVSESTGTAVRALATPTDSVADNGGETESLRKFSTPSAKCCKGRCEGHQIKDQP